MGIARAIQVLAVIVTVAEIVDATVIVIAIATVGHAKSASQLFQKMMS
jgi:hypothetical protein